MNNFNEKYNLRLNEKSSTPHPNILESDTIKEEEHYFERFLEVYTQVRFKEQTHVANLTR
ncbi:hypothetical protein MXB_3462 [Myxobolus squamalis]|nr:hypothetical protein MXB_3462 [Myxobolus squamalis]